MRKLVKSVTYLSAAAFLLFAASQAQAKLGRVKVICKPAGFVVVDGQMLTPKPTKKTTFGLERGKHTISTYNVGYMEEHWDIQVYPGSLTTLEVIMVPLGQDRDEMVPVEGGTLSMGVDRDRVEWLCKRLDTRDHVFRDSQPVHEVEVKSFHIDKYEVTNARYAKFVKATNHRPPKHWRGGRYPEGKADYPVVNVSWHDAAAYAKWAGKRLPTEAEWEMAARSGTNHVFPWGQVFRKDRANTSKSSFGGITITGRYEKGASPVGCMDMGGNVAEWTATWYDVYPGQTASHSAAGTKTLRVVRGGSWKSKPHEVTAVFRDKQAPDKVFSEIGFRCVK